MEIERRVVTGHIESRADDDGMRKIAGYAAVWDTPADIGPFVEQIQRGAFTEAIERDDVRALVDHVSNLILGRNTAGTLRLWEDDTGLGYEIIAPDTSYARDLLVSLERGDVSQSSFGFLPEQDGQVWDYNHSPKPLRTVTRARLFDVSPVTFPAYNSTTSEARSLALQRNQPAGAGDDNDEDRAAGRRARMVNWLKLIEIE